MVSEAHFGRLGTGIHCQTGGESKDSPTEVCWDGGGLLGGDQHAGGQGACCASA